MVELADIKHWNAELEREITSTWRTAERFLFMRDSGKPVYSIDTPPPYINAPIHMGHAVTYTFMDFFARYKRMKGFEVLFPLGLDNNGLPIEMGTEKRFKISALSTPREEFLAYCKQLIDEFGVKSIESFERLGISFTSYQETGEIGSMYRTDNASYRALTQKTFVDLYKKGFIYEDSRINNWDPKLRTTIADSEIVRVEKETDLNYVRFKLVDSDEDVVIATTRPELLCTSALIIFNPEDERYTHLAGKRAITPLFGNEVQIVADSDARPEFGSGIVFMSSSGGDVEAVKFLRRMGIDPVSAVDISGKMNEKAGFLEGLSTREARAEVIRRLTAEDLLVKQEKLMHAVPTSERSGAEIEFVEMPELYLKQTDIVADIRKISSDMRFFPEQSRETLNTWLDSISIDWPISRRRFYATEIPLWYSELDGKHLVALPSGMQYYQPWKDDVPKSAEVWCEGQVIGTVSDSDFSELTWNGETRVFDTWMDSSISELNMLQYHRDEEFFAKSYPASLRPQGKEIIRTWLYYTLVRGYLETGKAAFSDVWINQHILDNKGHKMSKSKGNVVDPKDLLDKFGAEAIRLWAATEGDLSRGDFLCSHERIAAEQKTITKLLNVAKFVLRFEKVEGEVTLTATDRLFIDYVNDLTVRVDSHYAMYDFYRPAEELRACIWDTFASHYIELVKNRAYNSEGTFSDAESASARYTLYYILKRLVILLYPVIPQVTSVISQALDFDVLDVEWPNNITVVGDVAVLHDLIEFNSEVWKRKKDAGVSLRDTLDGVIIPANLKVFSSDLKACHGI